MPFRGAVTGRGSCGSARLGEWRSEPAGGGGTDSGTAPRGRHVPPLTARQLPGSGSSGGSGVHTILPGSGAARAASAGRRR